MSRFFCGDPPRLATDFGKRTALSGVRYLPRGDSPGDPGWTKAYRFYLSYRSFGWVPAP